MEVLALVKNLLALAQLSDHLLGGVAVSFHVVRPLCPPFWAIGSHMAWTTIRGSRQEGLTLKEFS